VNAYSHIHIWGVDINQVSIQHISELGLWSKCYDVTPCLLWFCYSYWGAGPAAAWYCILLEILLQSSLCFCMSNEDVDAASACQSFIHYYTVYILEERGVPTQTW